MLRNKGELAELKTTRKVHSMPRPEKPQASMLQEVKSLGKADLSLMLQGAMTSPADIAKGQVIQKADAGSGQMQYANTARRKAMLKGFAKAKANQGKVSHNSQRLRLE